MRKQRKILAAEELEKRFIRWLAAAEQEVELRMNGLLASLDPRRYALIDELKKRLERGKRRWRRRIGRAQKREARAASIRAQAGVYSA